ncbi:Rne/Rng family ribonuclease [Gammaproteobacteria bacterium]|nr:Rne/Rng family ribonuclease [Gammaproteobacteria bacterium]
MKRMLINATQQEELRMAMVDGQRLFDLNIELPAGERKKANIYKGKITRIEPSLEAAFVDFGADRHGFLPLKEISSEYFIKPVESGKPNIKEVLKEGQDIVVQIDKEERGNKGAALTTFVSLAGRFIVLKPNKPRSGGVSRRIVGSDRDLARESLNEIAVPDGMSVILRTAGIDRSAEELAWDLENLLTIWTAILNVVLERSSPFLIYRESNSVVRALRDYLSNDIGEILIDDEQTYKEALEFVEQVMPHNLKKLKHYNDPVPLFTRFQIESQIESAFTHSVTLPSGGSIVIDHTEALVSIDINSARATKGGDIEATALNTNLEAAEEIARQLRIRDLGGLIVIDFIDMGPQKHQRDVENRLREAARQDRARVQIGKISRFGLLEMSRQRLRPSLGESSYLTCPRCSGIGTIRSVESLALAILRIIGEEARKERTAKVIAQLPVEVATYLLNEKRDWVQSLESRNEMQVVLVANPALETPHYDVRRVRDDQTELPENAGASYELSSADMEPESPQAILERKAIEPAAISVMKPSKQAPKPKKPGKGFWASLAALFTGDQEKKKPVKGRRKAAGKDGRSRGQQQRSRSRSDDRQKTDGKRAGRDTKRSASKKTGTKKKARAKTAQQQEDGQQKQLDPSAEQRDESKAAGKKKPARSRRSRGGRRRRRSDDRQEQTTEQPQQSQTDIKPDEEQARPPRARTDAERAAEPQAQNETSQGTGSKPKAKTDVDTGSVASTRSGPKPEPAGEPARASRPASTTEAKAAAEPARVARPESKPASHSTTDRPDPKPEPRPTASSDAVAKTAPESTPPRNVTSEGAKQPESKPAASSDTAAKPAAEPKPAPKATPEAGAAQPKVSSERAKQPASKPAASPDTAAKPAAEPKPAPKATPEGSATQAEPKPVPKPEGRLLPWDAPVAAPAEKPVKDTKPADAP